MTSAYGNDRYPGQRGFALNLAKGSLSATLNYTTTTAADPFPLNQWVQVAVAYDGQALTVYQDGKQVAATTAFPAASEVMGWDKKTIHTGNKDIPFAGSAPEGVLRQRVIGPTTQENQNALEFTLAPGETANLVLSILTDRNTPDFLHAAQLATDQVDTGSLAKLFRDHTTRWAQFWSKSFIKNPRSKNSGQLVCFALSPRLLQQGRLPRARFVGKLCHG